MRSRVNNARNNLIMKFALVLVIVLVLYTLFVSYSVYRKLLGNNYESLKNAIRTTADNMSQTLDMMRSTTYALSGSQSVKNWIKDRSCFTGRDKQTLLNRQNLNEEMQRMLIYNNTWNFELFDYIAIYENSSLLAITYTKQYSIQQIINDTGNVQKRLSAEKEYAQVLPPQDKGGSIYTTLRIQSDFQSEDSIYIIGATGTDNFQKKLKNLMNHNGTTAYMMRADGTVFASGDGGKLGENLGDTIVSIKNDLENKSIDGADYQIIKGLYDAADPYGYENDAAFAGYNCGCIDRICNNCDYKYDRGI